MGATAGPFCFFLDFPGSSRPCSDGNTIGVMPFDTDKLPHFVQRPPARRVHRSLSGTVVMSKQGQPTSAEVISFPPRVALTTPDADIASMIEVLQDQLAMAREGKLRSVAVVSVSADGEAIGTQWSCKGADVTGLIGKLTVLTHDLMAARK